MLPLFLIAAALQCAGTVDPRCPIYGDVDGDGHADRVAIARADACHFAVVVRTRRRLLRTAIPEPSCKGKPSEFWGSGFPRVIALRPMNAHKGFEVEVTTWAGASNYGVRFFTVLHGRLQRMRIRPEPFPKDEWDVGGFADAYAYHDCLRPHVVGVAGASYTGHDWLTFGAVYRVTANAFVEAAHRTGRTKRYPAALWPYVRGDNFTRCRGVNRVPLL